MHLASIDTPITTPQTAQTDLDDSCALDGESQLEQTKNLIMKNVEDGMKLYPMAFATPHLRTFQTHAGTLGSQSDVIILPVSYPVILARSHSRGPAAGAMR